MPRRAGAQRILRRPLPRGVSDAGRRGAARRRALLLRRRLGVSRAWASRPTLHKEPLDFEYVHPTPAELQVMKLTLHVWRQKNAAASRAVRALRCRRRQPRHVVPRDARRAQRGADRARAKSPIAFDHDCREGICGIVRLHDQRRRARPAARHHRLPAPHAPLQGRRRAVPRAVARAARSR